MICPAWVANSHNNSKSAVESEISVLASGDYAVDGIDGQRAEMQGFVGSQRRFLNTFGHCGLLILTQMQT